MNRRNQNNSKRADLALNVHLEEYKVVFTHVIERAKIRHTLINYTIILFAAVITLSATILKNPDFHLPFLFLPIPFFIIVGLLLENDFIIAALVAYYYHDLRPKISKLSNIDITETMNMEEYLYVTRESRFYFFLAGARLIFISVIPTASVLSIYWNFHWGKLIPIKLNHLLNIPTVLSFTYLIILAFLFFYIVVLKGMPNPPNLPRALIRAKNNKLLPLESSEIWVKTSQKWTN